MKIRTLNQALGLVAGTSVALFAAPQVQAADNPFAFKDRTGATLMVVEAGKEKGISVLEGKCGSGKCGSQRVREMMDRDGDGSINRNEYIGWATTQAGREFDSFAGQSGAVGADEVFEHFQSLEYHQQG